LGPILNLLNSDIGVIRARKLLLDSMQDFLDGKPANGLGEPAAWDKIMSPGTIIPQDVDWRDLFKTPELVS
jgi:hypothetical protein